LKTCWQFKNLLEQIDSEKFPGLHCHMVVSEQNFKQKFLALEPIKEFVTEKSKFLPSAQKYKMFSG
jgi:hypothetical protein